jgi:hypothetical protein
MQAMRDVLSVDGLGAAAVLGEQEGALLSIDWAPIFSALVAVYTVIGAAEVRFAELSDAARRGLMGIRIDPLTSQMLIVMAAVSSLNKAAGQGGADARVVARMTISCLNWLLGAPAVAMDSASAQAVIAGLIGASSAAHSDHLFSSDADRQVFARIMDSLSLAARCELLKLFLAADREAVEGIIDEIMRESFLQGGRAYVPYVAMAALTSSLQAAVFAPSNAPADPPYMRFRGVKGGDRDITQIEGVNPIELDEACPSLATHNIVFRTLWLSYLDEEDSSTLERAAQAFQNSNMPAKLAQRVILGQLHRAVRVVRLLDLASEAVARAAANDEQHVDRATAATIFNGEEAAHSVAAAIAVAPRAFSAYLLGQLPDITAATAVLQNGQFFTQLGAPWWHSGIPAPLAENQQISEREALARIEAQVRSDP